MKFISVIVFSFLLVAAAALPLGWLFMLVAGSFDLGWSLWQSWGIASVVVLIAGMVSQK